jgi:hypothetical protein
MFRPTFEHWTRVLVVLTVAFGLGYHHRARADVFTPLLWQSGGYQCSSWPHNVPVPGYGAGIYASLGPACAALHSAIPVPTNPNADSGTNGTD